MSTSAFEKICLNLAKKFPGVEMELESFQNGSEFLDVCLNDREFVCDCNPDGWYGIDEVLEDAEFNSGYKYTAATEEEAEKILFKLIEGNKVE